MRYENGMTLGELEEALAKMPSAAEPPLGFAGPHSYRGYYECVAFEPVEDVSFGQMLESVREAKGSTYEGYKGGEFVMDGETECFFANYGGLGEAITPVLLRYMFSVRGVERSEMECARCGDEMTVEGVCGECAEREMHAHYWGLTPTDVEKMLTVLEHARRDLASFDGLVVADGAAPGETWPLDCSRVLGEVDEVLERRAG